MYGVYERSGINTSLVINIFIPKLFPSLFNIIISIPDENRRTLIGTFYKKNFVISQVIKCTLLLPSKYLLSGISMFISFSSKLLKFISIAASLFLGLKVDFSWNLIRSNSLLSFHKCYFKRNILLYVSSSNWSFAFLTWMLVGTIFSPLDNNEISSLFSFRLEKLTTFLLTKLPLIRLFK